MQVSDRRIARIRLAARRRRLGRLRGRAVLASLALFAIAWMLVFAQLVSGHDPVLGSGRPTSSPKGTERRPSRSSASTSQSMAIDPVTGQVVQAPPQSSAPSSGAPPAPTQQAPAPPPVTTSTS